MLREGESSSNEGEQGSRVQILERRRDRCVVRQVGAEC